MSAEMKTSFDLEPNPFERSFATKETHGAGANAADVDNKPNKHNLHIPNLSSLNHSGNKLPGLNTPLFTPGGRRLPPLGLSPGASLVNPETPGSTLWNSLLNVTTTNVGNKAGMGGEGGHHMGNNNVPAAGNSNTSNGNNPSYGQFVGGMRKTGLTPSESNLRSGLTPGGLNQPAFNFGAQVPGLTTPGSLLNNPMIPGLSNILTGNNSANSGPNEHHNYNSNYNYPSTIDNIDPSKGTKEQRDVKAEESAKRKRSEESTSSSKKAKIEQTKTKATKSKSKKLESDDEMSGNESNSKLTEGEKRKNFLERNRLAASKCRQRKKQLIQKMEDELTFYSSGYRELSAQVTQLRDQLVNLKGIIVGHKDCPMFASSVGGFDQLSNVIQQINYVTHMTTRSQTNVTSIPSTIPTTLNEGVNNSSNSNPYGIQRGPPTNKSSQSPANFNKQPADVAHPNATTESSTNSSINLNYTTNTGAQRHNMDMANHQYPQIQNNIPTNINTDVGNGTLRAISSMSNIAEHSNAPNGNITSHHSLTDLHAAGDTASNINTHSTGSDLRSIQSMSNIAGMSNSNDHRLSQQKILENYNHRR